MVGVGVVVGVVGVGVGVVGVGVDVPVVMDDVVGVLWVVDEEDAVLGLDVLTVDV